MTMNFYLRLAIVCLGGIMAAVKVMMQNSFIESSAVPPLKSIHLLIIFLFSIFGILFVMTIQDNNPKSPKSWEKPSWNSNPFVADAPLNYFHLAAYFFIAAGLGDASANLFKFSRLGMDGLTYLAIGLGLMLGVMASGFFFQKRF